MRHESCIVAFESVKSCERIRDILERDGAVRCVVCRTAAEVRRAVHTFHISSVVCGSKFPDSGAEELFADLPPFCSMLMVASQDRLEMCGNDDVYKLAAPVSRRDLLASVEMLLRVSHREDRFIRPQRSEEDAFLIAEAKAVLMDRQCMSEDQAHRYLQKKSMDTGAKLVDTARLVLSRR